MELLIVLLESIRDIVLLLIQLYIFVVIARALISWVNPDPYNPIVRFLHNATDPVFYRIRRILPLHFGGMDLTPIALLIALTFSSRIIAVLFSMAISSLRGY